MKTAFHWTALVMLALILAACTPQTIDTPETVEPVDVEQQDRGPAVERLNPRDFTDPRNLDNSDSLLSERLIYFEFDRSNVRPQFRPVVEAHAAYLRANPSARVVLEGHADERGSREYNLGLGERRGNAVAELLRVSGAPSSQIDVVSYGEERPVCRQSTESCWQRNRRVEIIYTSR